MIQYTNLLTSPKRLEKVNTLSLKSATPSKNSSSV